MVKLAVVIATLLTAASICAAPLTDEQRALHVLNRLGYGPAPGDLQQVQAMGVERYIDQQLHPERIALPAALNQRLDALRHNEKTPREMLAVVRPGPLMKLDAAQQQEAQREIYKDAAQLSHQERLYRAIYSPRQLEEVMTDFWFNHFNVYADKGLTRVFVTDYERNAIRPYVLGRFRDLLGATAKHPAMLFYLDNWESAAPDFQGKNKRVQGLNENYARELMELHTLGVDGGYTQKDVTELARMLTGWTFDPRASFFGGGSYTFDARRHDTHGKEWLNRHVEPRGQAEGEWALDVLAASPVTAHHISYQLAQYFVADEPPASLVDKLTQRFINSQGDIRAVLTTLFASPEFWDSANVGNKFKTPYQLVVSATRAAGVQVNNVKPLTGALYQLGMPLYGCQTPDGYKNTEAAWLNPDAITRRINLATALGTGRLALSRPADSDASAPMGKGEIEPLDPVTLANTLGPALSDKTLASIQQADPNLRAALMLGSPDFQRH
ncbi:Uncharacterized conserved protein, DUF1800 family [Andreprevotia lacus DSM 23236]|jgi:uncharacterized protein (DUF1800 family)|uniref:Uncharacterized conserved protein, DUF1800 family n=1 Tax=Andreprevotia lacus DSM 23236 TaxID=1121001 RepID=A0A1W1XKD5_9NEIS|nr:DUF1800 domain-containing protein [Andreprevotia lacus]SMC24385.1 Uncharacterized conserved protein, DUF1800 family [Andreprevotia lacus DSM 23236]